MKQLLLCMATMAFLASSCQVNYEKTKSGLPYKIFSGKTTGAQLKPDNFVKINIEYSMPGADTPSQTTYGKFPLYAKIDTSERSSYSFMEILPKCKEGDSVVFSISVDTLKNRKLIPEYDSTYKRGDIIKGKMSILKVFTKEDEVNADYEKEIAAQKENEVKSIEAYLAKNNIKAQKTKNGVFVEIEKAGDAALKADSGKLVSIMYKGYLQSNGHVFDTNMDTTKGHTDPISIVVGQGRVIPGWEEGIPYFGKGGKGKLFIPATLGYGSQGSQGAIPPFANLIFDIEIVDVKDAPKQQQGNPYDNLTPEQMQQLQQQMQQQQQQRH